MKRMWLRILLPTLTIVVVTLFVGAHAVRPAGAQEGPECPAGFFWRANSGVGCMQEGCLEVANTKYSYTGACICVDGYKACYEPVDSGGVECGPFCPVSRLTACINPDAACPGESPSTAPEGGSADAPSSEDVEEPVDESDAEPSGVDVDLSADELMRDLEEFLAGGEATTPSAGRAAAAGTVTATLIGTWVLINLLSGASPADVLRAISEWRQDKTAETVPARGGNGAGKAPEVAERPDDDTPSRADPVEAPPIEGADSVTSPQAPESPPDLPTLRRTRLKEVREAKRKIELLHQLQKRLDETYRRLVTEWEVARRCAVFDGVLDIADIYLWSRGKLLTSTVRGAYGKDLAKRTIKGAFRKVVRYRVDGTFDLTGQELYEGMRNSLGVGARTPASPPREPAASQYVNPIEFPFDDLLSLPGGAYKQWLQNYYGTRGPAGKLLSDVYGPAESVYSAVDAANKSADRCEALRQQMSTIRRMFDQSNRALETAQTDLEVAQSAISAIDKDIAELKKMFPHRFRDL